MSNDYIIICACEDHIDKGIDEIVNKYEVAPNVEKTKNIKCKYCDNEAYYQITYTKINN